MALAWENRWWRVTTQINFTSGTTKQKHYPAWLDLGSNASFFGISVLVRRDTSAVFSGYRDSCFDFNFRISPFTWEPECRESKYLKGMFFSGKKTTWDSICCPWDRKQNLWNTFSSTKAHWFNLRSGPILEDFGHSLLFAFPAGIIVTKQNEYILSLFSS